jgi:predicted TIM-barrel fold metal-dependent hydrolase
MTRRELFQLTAAALPAVTTQAAEVPPVLIDTHIHLFEPARFPYHPNGTYNAPAQPLAPYLAFAKQAGLRHSLIIHPEPYQDDHRYLWYCFEHEDPKGFFKGTLLLDPIDPKTPDRMSQLVKEHPNRLVAMRIHASNGPGEAPTKTGAIRNRDLKDPQIQQVWRRAADLGLAIQMHFLPHHAPAIGALCARFPQVTVILDHMGRTGMGTQADLANVIALAKYPKVIFKYSGWSYFDKGIQVGTVVKQAHREFGPNRIIWGGLGMDAESHKKALATFQEHWSFASTEDRAKIAGGNALALWFKK